jgi:GTP-binding protein
MIRNVKFCKSIFKIEQMFNSDLPEVVFIGRSNVGKSSLINALTGQKNLAKTSSTPGKTQSINYFSADDKLYIVDMPGYGYAKISKDQKIYWKNMIEKYFIANKNIRMSYVLVDSRYDIMDSDLMMIDYLNQLKLPVTVILTKTDKISTNEIQKRIKTIKSSVEDNSSLFAIISTSSEKKNGIKELSEQIISLQKN